MSASTYLGITLFVSLQYKYYSVHTVPVCFPDVNGIFILDVMFFCLLIKKVKEVFHSWWHHMVWVEHAMKEVIYELLKCTLKANLKKSITFVLQAELGAVLESFIPVDTNSP